MNRAYFVNRLYMHVYMYYIRMYIHVCIEAYVYMYNIISMNTQIVEQEMGEVG
jgi:hypothetical protein